MKKHSLVLFLFLLNLIATAQCYFSPTGDTILVIDNFTTIGDSAPYQHTIYCRLFSDSATDYHAKEIGAIEKSYSDEFDYAVLPEGISHFLRGETEDLYYNEVNGKVKMDLDIRKIKFVGKEQGGCSKGCQWNSSYVMKTNFSLRINGEIVWAENFEELHYAIYDYIAWGKKPHRRGRLYLKIFPDEVMWVDIWRNEVHHQIFMRFCYFTEPMEKGVHFEKFFLMEDFL